MVAKNYVCMLCAFQEQRLGLVFSLIGLQDFSCTISPMHL